MDELIDYITGRPIESQDMESIQQAIDALTCATITALRIREELKEKRGSGEVR